jgi:hypothetical protein
MIDLGTTLNGERIHTFDMREGYEVFCAICGDAQDGHADQTHPFMRHPEEPVYCPGCGALVNPDLHYGVYITRVAYVIYDKRECAWKHDKTKFL